MQNRWAVAITQPLCENKAVFHAEKQGFECYLPKIRTKHRIEPLFPRYVFVAIDGAWRALLTTIGVSGMITSANQPATLSDYTILELRSRCDKNDVFIEPEPFRFKRGMHVRVKYGPLMGYEGTVHRMRGRERVEVLLKMLGTRTKASIYEGDLAVT